VIDLDIRKFFDTMPWELAVKAIQAVTDLPWVVLYVRRWLAAPLARPDGTLQQRDRGTPQGSAVSPVIANLFLHYAFDMWMTREFPGVPFERYVDDAVIHCATEQQACQVLAALRERMTRSGSRCIRTRPGSCPARTPGGAAHTSTPRSRSGGTGSGAAESS
jgi:RNA-directed DNA polymerase